MSSCEMGLTGFFVVSLVILICSQIALERMRQQLREEKLRRDSQGQEGNKQKQ